VLILAFDTSVAACSVALCRGDAVLAQTRALMDRGQAEALMPMIEEAMARAGRTYRDLDRIAVTVGPGSFTGVRVGLAAARGLGLAAGKPVVGVPTTEVLAAAIPEPERKGRSLVAAIDTKRGDLYVQRFGEAGAADGPRALYPEDISAWLGPGDTVAVGDGAPAVVAVLGARALRATADAMPDPVLLARLAARRTPAPPLPLYVHPPAITPAS
jgi:tRNA threonylcarbamoyladenosine biosynthesis protein TsaB